MKIKPILLFAKDLNKKTETRNSLENKRREVIDKNRNRKLCTVHICGQENQCCGSVNIYLQS
jgi:hypothetical protein